MPDRWLQRFNPHAPFKYVIIFRRVLCHHLSMNKTPMIQIKNKLICYEPNYSELVPPGSSGLLLQWIHHIMTLLGGDKIQEMGLLEELGH